MYEFWYDYVKKKYGDMVKLCYMDTDSLIMNIKTKDFWMLRKGSILQITVLIGHYLKEKNKKVIGLMKDELGGGIITEFVALRPKTFIHD